MISVPWAKKGRGKGKVAEEKGVPKPLLWAQAKHVCDCRF